jgi:manganese/zinc/iron transport system ATP- binding protein
MKKNDRKPTERVGPTGSKDIPLEAHELTVAYQSKPVLWNIDFQIPKGKLMGIVGPNGAGKTTLLKAIMNIVEPASGWVKVYGQPYEEMQDRVGYVPQRESVDWDFPTTVLDVTMMGRYGKLGFFRRPGKDDEQAAMSCLEKVGMEEFADRQISQLSGGQQQRVFLARALAQEADLYLMDEPFVGVDATTEKAIVNLLDELKDQGKTIVLVHHDLQTLQEYFDWLLLLNVRLVGVGPMDEVMTEENLRDTYGGQLDVLSRAAETVEQHGQ